MPDRPARPRPGPASASRRRERSAGRCRCITRSHFARVTAARNRRRVTFSPTCTAPWPAGPPGGASTTAPAAEPRRSVRDARSISMPGACSTSSTRGTGGRRSGRASGASGGRAPGTVRRRGATCSSRLGHSGLRRAVLTRIETRRGIGRPVSASTTSPRSDIGCDVPAVGGSGRISMSTSHSRHEIPSPSPLGRESTPRRFATPAPRENRRTSRCRRPSIGGTLVVHARWGPVAVGRPGSVPRRSRSCSRSDS